MRITDCFIDEMVSIFDKLYTLSKIRIISSITHMREEGNGMSSLWYRLDTIKIYISE